MDYKDKYNKALERASKLRVQNPFDTVGQMVEYIFPELKESKDEHKKWILEYLYDGLRRTDEQFKDEFKAAIAWFEKQCEKESDPRYEELEDLLEADTIYQMAMNDAMVEEAKSKAVNALSNLQISKLLGLEKQGEQKPYGQRKECEDCQFNYAGECKGFCQMKKDEQKPADNVEPKFKVGDWLQYRYAEPFLVEEITEQGYCNGNSCLPFEWEDEIHPWTIQDAKDGDIVYYECHGNKHLFIVKYVGETKDHVEGHFWYDITRNEHEVWDGRLPYSNIASMRDAMPATKEQRDLLFQKMKIVGYEWDSEKKELNKIEVKTLDPDKVIEWLRQNNCTACWDDPNEAISQYIERFKKDFGL